MRFFVRIEHQTTGLYLGIGATNTSVDQHPDWVSIVAVNSQDINNFEEITLWEVIPVDPLWNDFSKRLKHVKTGAYLSIREITDENNALGVFFEEPGPAFNIPLIYDKGERLSRDGEREYLSIRRVGPRTAIWVKAEEADKSSEEMLFIYHEAHGPGAVRGERNRRNHLNFRCHCGPLTVSRLLMRRKKFIRG